MYVPKQPGNEDGAIIPSFGSENAIAQPSTRTIMSAMVIPAGSVRRFESSMTKTSVADP
jgi:hypothetical protein